MSVDYVREGENYVIMQIDENRMPIFTHVTCKSEIIDFKFDCRFIETMDGKRYLLDDVYLSEEDAKMKYIKKIKNNINRLKDDIYYAEEAIKQNKENLHRAIKASSLEEAKEKAKCQLSLQFEIIRII